MICRQCGTEIADKALICFRCGTATTEAKFKAPPARRSRSSPLNLITTILALGLLVVVALYMGQVVTGEVPRMVTWAVVAIAVVVLLMRRFGRRR
jgi:hypothetical protein